MDSIRQIPSDARKIQVMSLPRMIAACFFAMIAAMGLGAIVLVWEPEIEPIDPGTSSPFDPALVRHGAELAVQAGFS